MKKISAYMMVSGVLLLGILGIYTLQNGGHIDINFIQGSIKIYGNS